MKQQFLAVAVDQNASYEKYRKPARPDDFVTTMERIVRWGALCGVVEPRCPKAGNGRPLVGLERMLRMYFVQHWLDLADEACEDALLDRPALRRFVGIDLGCERLADATTLLKFRRLIETHELGAALFAKVGKVLQVQGLKVGTARSSMRPSSPRRGRPRTPLVSATRRYKNVRKRKQWHFGMKLHIGVDSETGLAHSAVVTAANVHDKHPLPELLHGAEQRVWDDLPPCFARGADPLEGARGRGLDQPMRSGRQPDRRVRSRRQPREVARALEGRARVRGG